MVLITSRPEYEGALTRMHGAQTISLAPLKEGETMQLLEELLGWRTEGLSVITNKLSSRRA